MYDTFRLRPGCVSTSIFLLFLDSDTPPRDHEVHFISSASFAFTMNMHDLGRLDIFLRNGRPPGLGCGHAQ
jgi:hypothetical protein